MGLPLKVTLLIVAKVEDYRIEWEVSTTRRAGIPCHQRDRTTSLHLYRLDFVQVVLDH